MSHFYVPGLELIFSFLLDLSLQLPLNYTESGSSVEGVLTGPMKYPLCFAEWQRMCFLNLSLNFNI